MPRSTCGHVRSTPSCPVCDLFPAELVSLLPRRMKTSPDPLVYAHITCPSIDWHWLVCAHHKTDRTVFCLVLGLAVEWGSVSIAELEAERHALVRHPMLPTLLSKIAPTLGLVRRSGLIWERMRTHCPEGDAR